VIDMYAPMELSQLPYDLESRPANFQAHQRSYDGYYRDVTPVAPKEAAMRDDMSEEPIIPAIWEPREPLTSTCAHPYRHSYDFAPFDEEIATRSMVGSLPDYNLYEAIDGRHERDYRQFGAYGSHRQSEVIMPQRNPPCQSSYASYDSTGASPVVMGIGEWLSDSPSWTVAQPRHSHSNYLDTGNNIDEPQRLYRASMAQPYQIDGIDRAASLATPTPIQSVTSNMSGKLRRSVWYRPNTKNSGDNTAMHVQSVTPPQEYDFFSRDQMESIPGGFQRR
jgi:hypothetical protein